MNLFTAIGSTPIIEALSLSLALASSWAVRKLLLRWKDASHRSLRTHLHQAIALPLTALPLLLCSLFLVHQLSHHNEEGLHDFLGFLEASVSIFFPAWLAIRLTRQFSAICLSLGWNGFDKNTSNISSRFIQVVIFVIAGLIYAQELGYSLSALLTFGGVGGIVVGLAAKDWLANFFGGLMLMFDRPFKEGDWIRSPDRQIEGHVEQIGWRLTQIRTFDRRPVFIPNSVFTNIVIETPSNMRNRRMVENFGLRYEDLHRVPQIMGQLMEAFEQHTELDCKEPHYARFVRYADSALDCQIRVHVVPTGRVDFLRVQESVLLIIAEVVSKAGAEFAYPVVRYVKDSGPT